jgi:hypothetical protein
MGLKWIFTTMVSVLFRPDSFWKEYRERMQEANAMRDYAAPVIAIVQLCKLPFIGVPRMAMLLSIISFTVDVAVLYLLSGAIVSIAGSAERPEAIQNDVMMVLCYSLTPVWLAEPFLFTGSWRWLFMAVALVHTLFISRLGILAVLGHENPRIEAFSRKSGFLVAMATVISFTLINGLIRFFISF